MTGLGVQGGASSGESRGKKKNFHMLIYEGQNKIKEICSDLLHDESKSEGGIPSKVFFPENEDDLRSIMYGSAKKQHQIRFIGNHTGTTGGSIPEDNEWAISFSRMSRILNVTEGPDGTILLKCEPGITLSSIDTFLKNPQDWPYKLNEQELLTPGSHFYAPDPTEMNAQLGGSIATNASGARSFRFGATRNSVHALSIITSTAGTISVERGQQVNPAHGFTVTTEQNTKITVPPYTYQTPNIKNASGYYSKRPMDLVDLFIGSEGTLGAVSSVVVKLQKSAHVIAGCSFFRSLEDAFSFAEFLRSERKVISIEFFDESALDFINKYRKQVAEVLPSFPNGSTQAILWEYMENEDTSFDAVIDVWEKELIKDGSSFSDTWSGIEDSEIERLKRFRHALPETINATIASFKRDCPSIRKIGTDTALPAGRFIQVYKEFFSIIRKSNLAHATFGHLGDYHIHINLLPSNEKELDVALNVYDEMMEITIDNKGTISAEHGVGKLKCRYLEKMYGRRALEQMKTIKNVLDPHWLLNRRSIFLL